MRDIDFTSAVQGYVADELAVHLRPYAKVLARLDVALSKLPKHHPGRPRQNELEQLRAIVFGTEATPAATRAPLAAPAAPRAGKTFKPGDVVNYRQGRGSFEAFVIRQDGSGVLVVERISDGKRVKRPASKLF